MTEEEMIRESEVVVQSDWEDTLFWYMQEHRELGYEKIADIFIKSFMLHAEQMARELRQEEEKEW